MDMAVRGRVAFSALFNESDDFLASYVENFLRHTDDGCHLFVNLPPGRSVVCKIAEDCDRVTLFCGRLARSKYGHTLLNGHVESFACALETLATFDYFCTLASNSLFVRPLDLAATVAALESSHHIATVPLDDLPGSWWWTVFPRSPALVPALRQRWGIVHAAGNQIEGFFAATADWRLLYDRRDEIIHLGSLIGPEGQFPFEEIMPSTVLTNFGSARYVNICHMFWDRPLSDSVTLTDVVTIGDRFPDHICILKWFERSSTNPVTAAVCGGMLRDLSATLKAAAPADRDGIKLGRRLVLESLVQALRQDERFMSLVATWPAGGIAVPFVHEQTITMRRQVIPLPLGGRTPDGEHDAYLINEDTGRTLDLSLTIEDGDVTTVTTVARPVDPGESGKPSELEGYLYLACWKPGIVRTFRIRLPLAAATENPELARLIVIREGDRYHRRLPSPIVDHDGYRELHYRGDPVADGDPVWLGIPFFSRCDVSVLIDVV